MVSLTTCGSSCMVFPWKFSSLGICYPDWGKAQNETSLTKQTNIVYTYYRTSLLKLFTSKSINYFFYKRYHDSLISEHVASWIMFKLWFKSSEWLWSFGQTGHWSRFRKGIPEQCLCCRGTAEERFGLCTRSKIKDNRSTMG